MKNVLFICESYYYYPSPNAICVKGVAEQLLKDGHKTVVLTLFNSEGQKEYENIEGVDIYRVDPGFIERNLYLNKACDTVKKRKKYSQILGLSRINGLLHAFQYPLLSGKQVKNLYFKADTLYTHIKFDVCVCVYHKIADVLAGILLKKKHPNLKLILYTLDAISGGWIPSIIHSKKLPLASLKRWEKYFFAHIDKMFAMESHRSFYETEEYRPYAPLIEYLDIPLLVATLSPPLHNIRDKKHLLFTGGMHKDTANPQYLLKLLEHLPDVVFDIYGQVSSEIRSEIENNLLFNHRLFLHGSINHDKILDLQKAADVLVNFGNANPNMIPCKIFEYMSTCHKIISFTHAETDSSLPYIRNYPLGLIIKEDDEHLDSNARAIRDFIANDISHVDPSLVEEAFIKNTPEYFVNCILAL